MLMPFIVATVLLFGSLLVYGTAMHLIVRVVVRLIRSGSSELGFWKSTAVMAIVTAITAAAHLTQIALWAVAFLLCGQVSTFETAFYLSAQSFTALGYWRRPAVRTVAVTRPPRGHQRPPVLWTVNGRVVRDHEPVDRPSPTHRNRVPERGSREPGASIGGRRRVIEVSIRILVRRTSVRRGGRVMSSVTLTPAAVSRPAVNSWLVATAVVIPTFMEILDTTIATASMRYIAGGLSATMNDSDWVMTSYLAANATILPITGWLSAHLGRRRYFLLSIAVFTLASVLCGAGHQPRTVDPVPGDPGRGRRRAPARQPGDPDRQLPAREAGHGHDGVRRGGADRPGHRPDAGWLYHGQLQLALDLPHQLPDRRPWLPDVPLHGR